MSDEDDFQEDTRKRCKEIIKKLKLNPPDYSYEDNDKKKIKINNDRSLSSSKNFKKKKVPDNIYAVEAIVSCTHDQKKFLVKWENYSWSESTWEPFGNIKHCKIDLKRFRERENILSRIDSYRLSENRITMINESAIKCMQFTHCKQLELDILESCGDEAPIYVYNTIDNDCIPEFKYIYQNIIRPEYAKNIGLFDALKCCDNCYAESDDEWCETTKEYICSKIDIYSHTFTTVCNNRCNCLRKPCPTTTRFKRKYKLLITKTEDKSWGLFAGEDIQKGDFICKCAGNLILRSEAKKNENGYIYDINYLCPSANTFNGDEFCYDLTKFGNESRFINHSCDPNCTLVPVYYGFENVNFYEIIFTANQNISFNTEITFDYFGNRKVFDEKCTIKCLCGSSNCRGFLPSNNGLVGNYWIKEKLSEKKVLIKLSKYLKEVNYKDSL